MNKMLFTLLLSCSVTTSWCMQENLVVAENPMTEHPRAKLNESNPSDQDITMDTDSTPSPSHASSYSSSNQSSPRDEMNKKSFQRMGRIINKKIDRIINDEKRIQETVKTINDTHEMYPAGEVKDIIGVVGYNGNIRPVHKDNYKKPTLSLEQSMAIKLQALTETLKHK
ncbi:hypothetical protein Noda2021_03800 [Candidatus Dependentiae bacterium Noda2021]|nr:hypothetical protein Noda2021_03800 [Candidatus Dependentiae bacterium Noda2021]